MYKMYGSNSTASENVVETETIKDKDYGRTINDVM